MKLTLLRHGITEGNRRRLYYGSTDLPLLQEGWEALEDLRAQGGYPTATRYYTSGMIRTEQTLLALYGPVSHPGAPPESPSLVQVSRRIAPLPGETSEPAGRR